MEETIARYQTEIEELQKSRKEILQKAKEEAEQLMQEANARIENTIRAIKEAQAEKEKTRQIRQELNDFRESLDTLTAKEQEEKIARKIEKGEESQQESGKYIVCTSVGRATGKERSRTSGSNRTRKLCQDKRTDLSWRSIGDKRQESHRCVRKYQNHSQAG